MHVSEQGCSLAQVMRQQNASYGMLIVHHTCRPWWGKQGRAALADPLQAGALPRVDQRPAGGIPHDLANMLSILLYIS